MFPTIIIEKKVTHFISNILVFFTGFEIIKENRFVC
jgi:hypothetical protein